MIQIQFHIHYLTSPGEQLFVEYTLRKGKERNSGKVMLRTFDGAHWIGNIAGEQGADLIYQYGIQQMEGETRESGPQRKISLGKGHRNIYLHDFWRSRQNINQIFLSSAFRDIIFKRKVSRSPGGAATSSEQNQLCFCLLAPDIPPDSVIGVVGDPGELGNWQEPVILDDGEYPLWKGHVPVQHTNGSMTYKYVLCDAKTKAITDWESGENRTFNYQFPEPSEGRICITDEGFRHQAPWWRGSGLAIPIFSLRSQAGFGIGEFNDLKLLSDISAKAGMKMIQVLPVNDTIATKTWKDSYPYAAISVFALHPLYINLQAIAPFAKKNDARKFRQDQVQLNTLEQVDFEAALKQKMHYLEILYQQEKEKTFNSAAFKRFLKANKDWLLPYAVFSHLRDENGTPDFNSWKAYGTYKPGTVSALAKKGSPAHDRVFFYVFLQYHADKQLKEAKAYAAEKGVVLKGDLPIGIYRYSCDAWTAPHLYHMDEQAGAPPDDYAELGQNWGFPTYNWEEMAKDGFAWWKKRMQKLSEYFDALRIDHILGFFRIWQVPLEQVQGTMGMFNPRLPYHLNDLYRFGIGGETGRYTEPYIRDYYLHELFGEDASYVMEHYLEDLGHGHFKLNESVQTQVKIKAHFEHPENAGKKHLLGPLYRLVSEILLLEEPGSGGTAFNPRITLNKTFSYQALSDHEKRLFDALYVEYYFARHDDFWRRQAMWKLPPLVNATDMLICGEDLGMIPAPVPGVMKELNIIPLEIQRMPKGNAQYGNPAGYDYLTVCSPSCHDMSTIRGWWEGDYDNASRFYHEHMHIMGQAPRVCAPALVEVINREHMNAPSILAIFPIQDLLGMDDRLKKQDAFSEQINEPSNPDHYWRYRLHLDLEDLLQEEAFLTRVRKLVEESGRAVT